MSFASVIQVSSLVVALLAVLLPIWLTVVHKRKDSKQKAAEILVSIPEQMDAVSRDYIRILSLRTLSGYKGDKAFFRELKAYDDPVKAVEAWQSFPLAISGFPKNPKLKKFSKIVWAPLSLLIISGALITILAWPSILFTNHATNVYDIIQKVEVKSNPINSSVKGTYQAYSVHIYVHKYWGSDKESLYVSEDGKIHLWVTFWVNFLFSTIMLGMMFFMFYLFAYFLNDLFKNLGVNKRFLEEAMRPLNIDSEESNSYWRDMKSIIKRSFNRYLGRSSRQN